MIKDDVSQITTGGGWCNVLTSSESIIGYNGRNRRQYSFNGGRWYLWSSNTATNNYDISNYTCIDVSQLNSYAVYEPFMAAIPALMVGASLMLVFWAIKGVFRAP